MSSSQGCQYLITRGQREGQPCGRAVYRKAANYPLSVCLQHMRMIEANKKYTEMQQQALLQSTYEAPQINKPEEYARTIVIPPSDEEEVLEAKQESNEDEYDDFPLLAMLEHVRKELKANKNY